MVGGDIAAVGYWRLKRADKGLSRAFLLKVPGYSKAPLTRLLPQWRAARGIRDRRGPPTQPFARRYGDDAVRLLVQLDRLHGRLSGPATKKLAERAAQVFGEREFETLAGISVAHLYNLRASAGHEHQRGHHTTTPSRSVAIAERRRPQPDGHPGYLRVDSVRQGDWMASRACTSSTSSMPSLSSRSWSPSSASAMQYLIPALNLALTTFPFVIRGFHSDNDSEYINHRLAELLAKLHIEFTKSRARRTNDNALVESQNASVVRKHLGHSHIPSHHANTVNAFLRDHLTPYLNYHRPGFFPDTLVDAKGRQRRRYLYANMTTPYGRFKSIPGPDQHLSPGNTFATLDQIAHAMTDNQAACLLNQEREKLSKHLRTKKAA